MMRFGKDSGAIHQMCYNHGIHLAVVKILYMKGESENVNLTDEEISDEDYSSSEITDNINYNSVISKPQIRDVLDRIRKIVKLFRKSPTKNSILQKYVYEKHGKEMKLILDVKTRWNSMDTMLMRFIQIRECIILALSDLNSLTLLQDVI